MNSTCHWTCANFAKAGGRQILLRHASSRSLRPSLTDSTSASATSRDKLLFRTRLLVLLVLLLLLLLVDARFVRGLQRRRQFGVSVVQQRHGRQHGALFHHVHGRKPAIARIRQRLVQHGALRQRRQHWTSENSRLLDSRGRRRL